MLLIFWLPITNPSRISNSLEDSVEENIFHAKKWLINKQKRIGLIWFHCSEDDLNQHQIINIFFPVKLEIDWTVKQKKHL